MSGRLRNVPDPQIERHQSEATALRREITALTKANDRLRSENAQMKIGRQELSAHKKEMEAMTGALAMLRKEKEEWYEPELARLKSHVEHAKFEKETQILRRRVMAYAEQARRAAGSVTALEGKLAEFERLRDSWYVPELERLKGIVAQHEKVKKEWFEPQLESRAAHIAQLQERVSKLTKRVMDLESKVNASIEKRLGRVLRLKGWEKQIS